MQYLFLFRVPVNQLEIKLWKLPSLFRTAKFSAACPGSWSKVLGVALLSLSQGLGTNLRKLWFHLAFQPNNRSMFFVTTPSMYKLFTQI